MEAAAIQVGVPDPKRRWKPHAARKSAFSLCRTLAVKNMGLGKLGASEELVYIHFRHKLPGKHQSPMLQLYSDGLTIEIRLLITAEF